MRFGAHYLPTYLPALDGTEPEFYDRMLEQFALLDELGFDDVWVTEHHGHEYGGLVAQPPVFLAAAARATRRLHLGVAVSVLPLHHPLDVAEAYAMLDVLSHGRLEFGVGRGNSLAEFELLGIDAGDSLVRMREAAELIRDVWTQDTVTYRGETLEYVDVRVLPKPVQQPHPPIWVGASRTDDTYRWAGRMGFHLMTLPFMYPPPVLRQNVDAYRAALAAAGHDPARFEVLGKFHIYVADTSDAVFEAAPYLGHYEDLARASRARRSGGFALSPSQAAEAPGSPLFRHDFAEELAAGNIIAGDATRCIEMIRHWRDTIGLTTISGTFFFGGMPQAMALGNIRRFAEQVMPAFRDSPPARPPDPSRVASASA
jgi:natural product biosynthesis luciferase-like monooxygenase protein